MDEPAPPDLDIRRLYIGRYTAAVGATAAITIWQYRGGSAACGVALGVLLSLINFAWLKAGAMAITAAAAGAPVSRPVVLGAVRFFARFLLLLVILCAIFISHLVPLAWVVAGLFAVPAAALLAGVVWLARGTDGRVA